jgi:hypothetical protein
MVAFSVSVKYVPRPPKFLTEVMAGGAMGAYLASVASDLSGSANSAIVEYEAVYPWNKDQYKVVGPEVKPGINGDRVVAQIGVSGPFAVAAELGGPNTAATNALGNASGAL